MSNLKKTLSSGFLLSFEAILRKMVGLVSTLVLARMLVPEDFGIIAIALMVMGLLDAVKQFGGGAYLLRAEKVTDSMLNTSWTIRVISSSIVSLILIAVAPLLVNFYDDVRLYEILWVYSSLFIAKGMGNPGVALLKREQNYLSIIKLSIVSKVISVTVAVTVALIYQNYWALIAGQYTISAVNSLGTYFIHPYRPKLSLENAKEQWSFSSWFLLQSVLGYCKSQLDSFLVSSTFSKGALGSYHTMKYLASIPTTYLLGPATEPLLVQLTKIKDTKDYFSQQYNTSLLVPLAVALPGCVFLFFNHKITTLTVLGQNWVEYSQLFAIFCVTMLTLLIQQHASRVLIIHAKTKNIFYFELLSFSCIYGYLILFNINELIYFATAKVSLEFLFALIIFTYVTIKYTSIKNYFTCLLIIIPVILSSLIASQISQSVKIEGSVFAQFSLIFFIFSIIYFTTLLLQAYVLKNRNNEWRYIWQLITKIKTSILDKIASYLPNNRVN